MDISGQIGKSLPELRRYARALCGSQSVGDAYAVATMEAILADATLLEGSTNARRTLFEVFSSIWRSSGEDISTNTDMISQREAAMQGQLSVLTPRTREALLLRLLEDFQHHDIARIMRVPPAEAQELVEIGMAELENERRSRVLIIEDEPLIAMDLSHIVQELGHDVIAVARTRDEAVTAVTDLTPDLILADVRLADGSSGIDAVEDILGAGSEQMPVIFITAYPHRLLTGERNEPTFVIAKPFDERKLRVLIDQALFFKVLPEMQA
ncbi:Response regulator receiver domain-containing protein [Monaibacterium marinum]|uniref:Response regulator receiver domain-containing protein n=1 Tax=Pontivivens marinum TaxID=1690039 RepID=A0A2C9CUE1_9RHOB|nr:response regulator [Monaibacterium marinum]SOH94745.1 Response regulator receiver domain-containing protein [Monaibacterium marinum]